VAFAVNDQLQVALTTDAARMAGSRWQAGLETDVGLLDNRMEFSYALAINSRGWVAGYAQSSSGIVHAVLWDGIAGRGHHRSLPCGFILTPR
jgi:hypothetical protein